jgi:hypothetical protein
MRSGLIPSFTHQTDSELTPKTPENGVRPQHLRQTVLLEERVERFKAGLLIRMRQSVATQQIPAVAVRHR